LNIGGACFASNLSKQQEFYSNDQPISRRPKNQSHGFVLRNKGIGTVLYDKGLIEQWGGFNKKKAGHLLDGGTWAICQPYMKREGINHPRKVGILPRQNV
jgi:hypothetical protein